jgi:hypothetical protein
VGPRAGLDAVAKRKISLPCSRRESNITVSINVKLCLCSTMYHAMKRRLLFNEAPHHEDEWWNGDAMLHSVRTQISM